MNALLNEVRVVCALLLLLLAMKLMPKGHPAVGQFLAATSDAAKTLA